ncbi:hypothetical protein GCM10022393_34610 [Aquimarina addita]|uniref:Uncharacterized protein n=1 Tax=Aquimarina addita TaxID=870485 RepID=A0ABP6UQU0_9FLAO
MISLIDKISMLIGYQKTIFKVFLKYTMIKEITGNGFTNTKHSFSKKIAVNITTANEIENKMYADLKFFIINSYVYY